VPHIAFRIDQGFENFCGLALKKNETWEVNFCLNEAVVYHSVLSLDFAGLERNGLDWNRLDWTAIGLS